MATFKNPNGVTFGTSKKAIKRVEIYLTNEVYAKLEKAAAAQSRSTKNFMETVLNKTAEKSK